MSSILSDIETVICKGDSINNAFNLKQRIKDQMVRFLLAKCENDYTFDMDLRLHSGSPLWIMNALKMNLSVEQIATLTGLSIEEIKSLAK
jgi:hypothetical protein